jgi:hypothetical protein
MSTDRQLASARDDAPLAPSPRAHAPASRPRLRLRLLGIAPEEASFHRRGFRAATPAARERLEQAGETFVEGYRAALADDDGAALASALDTVDLERRGFAYEGAAMALALLDRLAPWRRDRFAGFVAGPGRPHVYMAHVGAGWALARLRRPPRSIEGFDPLLGWLALDGYGFHEGYFKGGLGARPAPGRFRGYQARAFDQGVGRSLWFSTGADTARAARSISRFDGARSADLWSGIALAATYAGGAAPDALGALRDAAGALYSQHVAQGAAFAAAAREEAGNPASHTELACRLLAGCTAREAADVTAAARRDLPPDGDEPAYEVWRARIRGHLSGVT